jgi:hypothetical protein
MRQDVHILRLGWQQWFVEASLQSKAAQFNNILVYTINKTVRSPSSDTVTATSIQLKLKLSHYMPQRHLGERRYSFYSFSTSALHGGEWSQSRPGCALSPGKGPPCTHCTGGWVATRAGLDTEDTGKILSPLPGIEPQSPGRPARHYTE